MKKQRVPILVTITFVFAAFTAGLYLGRSNQASPITVSIPPSLQTAPTEAPSTNETIPEETVGIVFPIDINRADKEEFMALPGIGDVLAQRILAYREQEGPFESVEELLNVEGIGKKRMEDMLELITIGG